MGSPLPPLPLPTPAPLNHPEYLVMRHVHPRFPECIKSDVAAVIDLGIARAQHAAYAVAVAGACGAAAVWVTDVSSSPDDQFIEDTAVRAGGGFWR